jgi:hypothetical protein
MSRNMRSRCLQKVIHLVEIIYHLTLKLTSPTHESQAGSYDHKFLQSVHSVILRPQLITDPIER